MNKQYSILAIIFTVFVFVLLTRMKVDNLREYHHDHNPPPHHHWMKAGLVRQLWVRERFL